jgi:hypothetical protein
MRNTKFASTVIDIHNTRELVRVSFRLSSLID